MNCTNIAKKIRLLLQLSQKEMAEVLESSTAAVSHWEKGTRSPRMPTVRRYMELAKKNKMKVSVEEFLN